jgi:hypothetical protein
MAAELGGSASQYLAELRRIHQVIGQVVGRLSPTERCDPRVVARTLAVAEGVDLAELLGEARRLAAEQQRKRRERRSG